uniref:Adenosine 3'-phospho 5'-phosphosulfate transporter 2 n=1 Tax=Oncorhynchus tshawytscha TaxID=74940 RepID=A0A8C8CIE9_ONCTS
MSDKFGPMNYNNARKHLSISIPSSSEVMMSPHIKSVEELRVLGINLSSFNTATQFGICTVGIFLFHLLYGVSSPLDGTLVQFGFYSLFGLVELQLTQDKRRRIPGKTYMIIAFLTVIFKCCKLIPVMIGRIFIQGKRYNLADVSAAPCMSLGLIWFTLADSKVAPNFNVTGVLLISLALCADAAIGNVQEKAMKLHNGSSSEMVLVFGFSIGFGYILTGLFGVGGLGPAVAFCSQHPVTTYGYAFFFSLTGYFGISFVLALIKLFGALVTVTVTTGRKAMTIILSFMFFSKPFTFQYIWSGLLVLLGIFLNVYSKNKDETKLPSLADLSNMVLTGKKVRLLSQNV